MSQLLTIKDEVVSGYETLRRLALGGARQKGGSVHGWALFAARGMVAWLRAFASIGPVRSGPASSPDFRSGQQCPVLSAELTDVLTNMVLAERS